MNPTTAALVAALKSAIQFAEATWGAAPRAGRPHDGALARGDRRR
jgi:hypothetical protein